MENIQQFLDSGILNFSHRVNSEKCQEVLRTVKESRKFGIELFVDEHIFKAAPKYKGVNPRPGRNFTEKLVDDLDFIESNEFITASLQAILGSKYSVKDKKFVCGVPKQWMPKWVLESIEETGVNNLGPYIKPEYQDITYFAGIDFHQDIIDWPALGPNFITMYVYLEDVGINDAPLHVIPNSHDFGATQFPHKLKHLEKNKWEYTADDGRKKTVTCELLLGKAGDVSLWHPFIIHGTQPDTNSQPRISLRYLIQVEDINLINDGALHDLNKSIKGKCCCHLHVKI